ncbi:MAG: hypothetical protein GKR86_06715 [Ilumatobacter sp.]|nr:hypothetical protein [Ilumatobacter sp.]
MQDINNTTSNCESRYVVQGDWKLIDHLNDTSFVKRYNGRYTGRPGNEAGKAELYNLAADIGEEKDLSDEKNGRVADLRGKLKRWHSSVTARMPIINPHYNEKRAPEWWSLRNGQPIDSEARKRFPQTEKDL